MVAKKWGTPVPTMSAAEILAAAKSDPDAQPLTAAELRKLKRVPKVKRLRLSQGLSQAGFAKKYQIPLRTLQEWEQGRSEPDQTTQAYLKVIAAKPELVGRTLKASA
jgi:putative transcriptional regulator